MLSRLLLVLVAFTASVLAAEPPAETDFVLGKKLTLKSAVLGEDRPLLIYTPSNYPTARASYPQLPVLYLLDGDDNFAHVTGLVDFLARKYRIPPMIIVAVGNTNRTRDLTPTHTQVDGDGKPATGFKDSGGGGKFFEFIRDELIPYVDKNYRTAPFRILDGHSFGGLFGVDVIQKSPATFQAYILVSPSLWWDQQVMLKHPGPIGLAKQFLFVSVGNEGGLHRKSIDQYVGQLKERAAPGLQWSYKSYDDESHGSVPHATLHDALRFIFAGWHLPDLALDAPPLTFAFVEQHYARLSEKYGYTLPIPSATVRNVVRSLAAKKSWNDALTAAQGGIRLYPKLASAQIDLAEVHEKKGDRAPALAAYRKALELDPKNDAATKALAKLEAKAP